MFLARPMPYAAFAALALLTACQKVEKTAGNTANANAANEVAANEALANGADAAPAAVAQAEPGEIKSKTAAFEFGYGWPGAAAAIPELDGWLRDNATALRAKGERGANEDAASAKKDGYPFNGHSYEEKFAVAADTPRVLVLQSDGYVYTGGAHGMPINTVIIWDKGAKKRLATGALIDVPALARLARDRFCKELDRQREEKRGEPVKKDDDNQIDEFTQCVDLAKQTVLPTSRSGKALDTVRVVIGPYEAGPYAEGTYTIELPIDSTLLGAVKPAWKDAFAVR